MQISKIGYEAGPDEDEALSRAEDILFQLRSGQGSRDFVHIREILDQYLDESGFGPDAEAEPLSVALTGFHNLDTLLGGLHRSDLIILAARPSLGEKQPGAEHCPHGRIGAGGSGGGIQPGDG